MQNNAMQQRYYALDVFRGATVALMILVNNPGSWSYIFPPLQHAAWHGCTPTDLVFPFFLFAVGNAMAFVMPNMQTKGSRYFLQKTFKRAVLIFTIGLLLNWSPFVQWTNDKLVPKPWETLRILGVLQRIAICYLIAALLAFYCKTITVFFIGIVILLLNWLLTLMANPTDPFSFTGYFGTQIDVNLLGENHLYKINDVPFDPEGLVSTIAAIVQVIMGYLAGWYIQQKGKTYEMLSGLFVMGTIFLLTGYFWDMVYPMNKKIWTSTYTIYTSGLAIVSLAMLIYLLEFNNYKGYWSKFFDAFGKNPLFIFVLSGFLPRLLGIFRIADHIDNNGNTVYVSALGWFYEQVCKNVSADLRVGSLLYAVTLIFFYWLIVWWMDKKKIYIKV